MNRLVPAWRASLRLAARSITRAKGRSALVALMIGAPVALSVILTTLYLTQNISVKESLSARMGTTQAQASFQGGQVDQSPTADSFSYNGDGSTLAQQEAAGKTLAALTDASIIPIRHGVVRLDGDNQMGVDVFQTDFTRPGTRGLIGIDKGRVPATAGEVAVSPGVAKALKLSLGSVLTVEGGTTLTVVGVGDIGAIVSDSGNTGIATLPTSAIRTTDQQTEFLIDRKAPVTWGQVQQLNKAGYAVTSRAVVNDPPGDDSVSYDSGSNADQTVFRLIVISVMIEVILLAGPAFAVGVRRQRRELALIAAAGGSPRDIRRVVLAQAGTLGFGASVVAAAAGLIAARLFGPRDGRHFGTTFGPFEWSPTLTALAILLGSSAAMIAAYAPARQVSREPLPTVLAGRRIEAGSRAGWPIFGLLVTIVGLSLTFQGARPENSDTGIATGAILVVVGVVFMTPTLIRLIAKLAPAMPLPVRLALRDTARHTSRSAPAIAAVMAAVAGIVALGIGGTSDQEEGRRGYQYERPEGVAVIFPGSDFDSVEAKAKALLPDRTLTPLPAADAYASLESIDCDIDDTCPWPRTDFRDRYLTTQIAVADAGTLAAWGIRLTAEQIAALEQGKALVPTLNGIGPSRSLLVRVSEEEGAAKVAAAHKVDVVKADLSMGPVPHGKEPLLASLVVSAETAKRLEMNVVTQGVLISGTVSDAQEKALKKVAPGDGQSLTGSASQLDVERGFDDSNSFVLLLLALVGGMAVLIGTLSATGLALNDARPDYATLSAIGASPVTRRVMAAAQALTIGVVGVALGMIVGAIPGILAARSLTQFGPTGDPVVAMPWLLFGILVVAVPGLAALVSGLFVRDRDVSVRRLAG